MTFNDIAEGLREKLPGFRALALVGPDGGIQDRAVVDPGISSETVSEFATLLRIAERTAEDTATGELSEMSWKSGRFVVLMRRVSPGYFLLLFGTDALRTGHARYALARAARRLALETGTSQKR